jgi:hypothetical protein
VAGGRFADHSDQQRVSIAAVIWAEQNAFPGSEAVAEVFEAGECVVNQTVFAAEKRFQPEAEQFGEPAAAVGRDELVRFIHNDSVHCDRGPEPDQVGSL